MTPPGRMPVELGPGGSTLLTNRICRPFHEGSPPTVRRLSCAHISVAAKNDIALIFLMAWYHPHIQIRHGTELHQTDGWDAGRGGRPFRSLANQGSGHH